MSQFYIFLFPKIYIKKICKSISQVAIHFILFFLYELFFFSFARSEKKFASRDLIFFKISKIKHGLNFFWLYFAPISFQNPELFQSTFTYKRVLITSCWKNGVNFFVNNPKRKNFNFMGVRSGVGTVRLSLVHVKFTVHFQMCGWCIWDPGKKKKNNRWNTECFNKMYPLIDKSPNFSLKSHYKH